MRWLCEEAQGHTGEQDVQELQAQLCPLQHQAVTWAGRAVSGLSLFTELKRGWEVVDPS